MSTETKLKEIVDQMKTARERMRQEGQEALTEAFQEFFRSHPEVKAIQWTQYTPWFNDGDTCTFSVHDWELKVDPETLSRELREEYEQYAEDYGSGYSYGEQCYASLLESISGRHSWRKRDNTRNLTPAEMGVLEDFNALQSACREEEDLLKEVMGDHCLVTVSADGIDVSEYEHD